MKKILTIILLFIALGLSAQRPLVYSLGHDVVTTGPRNFNLYGVINSYGSNVSYSFIYSTDSTFATSSATAATLMSSDSLTVVWATVDSMAAASTYFYYLHANTTNGPVSGDTLHFYTDTINPYFQIHGADVYASQNGSGVSMNGKVSGFSSNITVSFQWGSSPVLLDSFVTSDVGTVTAGNSTSARGSVFNGLNWGGVYYYRMRGITATDTVYSDIRPFYIGMPYTVMNTLPATSVGPTSATMNATVKGFPVPLKLDFEYGMGMGNHHSPLIYVANDTALYNFSYTALQLQTNEQYNYRFRAESWLGNFYGNNGGDWMFITGSKDSVFQTAAATSVGTTTATVNGFAQHLNSQIVGGFEYGTTPALGTYVVADTITDALTHYPTFTLTGLTPGTTYYYALKGGEYGDWQGTGPHLYGDTLTFVTGTSGINNITGGNNDLRIYPNPAANMLYIDIQNTNISSVKINDALGRIILSQNIVTGNSINVSDLAPGIYFVASYSKAGEKSGVTRFVKQ